MSDREKIEHVSDDGTYGVKKKSKINVFALIICLLVSFLIWCYAKGNAIKNDKSVDPTPAPIETSAGAEA